MTKGPIRKVAFIASYLPRKCGIATFTSDLIESVGLSAKEQFQPLVVAMRSENELKYDDPVKFEIRQGVKNDYISGADYINFSHVDLVSVQHEFGLYGGEAGSYLSLLLNRLNAPVITTLHTVLNNPSLAYHKSMVDVCEASYKIITMNEKGVDMLRDIYGVQGRKVELVPHGIPDLPFVDSNYYKHKFGIEGRKTILTFGLLSKNKGIEVMLRALPGIIEVEPSTLYIVLGMTHPSVLKHDGESYRFQLQRLVKELGLQEHVIFHNRFVSNEELHNFLCAADVYVTPYLNREQLTSGTLSFAVGAGKAVVSTPYWAAEELLAEGRGKLVPFGDSAQMSQTIIEMFENDSHFYGLRRRAYEYGRSKTWPKIGQAYWKLFSAKRLPVRVPAKVSSSVAKSISSIELPDLSLDHLKKMTDDTGLFQHASFTIPNREYGYCTDDNARAMIFMTKYCAQYADPAALGLFDRYLSFVLNSQNRDGLVRNFMNFDRTWVRNEPVTDAFGRFMWALGAVMARPPAPAYLPVIKDCFDKSVHHVQRQYPRGMAYCILGMSDYLHQFPGASDIKREMSLAADGLATQYSQNSQDDWHWFEEIVTYDNAILPHSLYVAAMTFENDKYLEVAEKTCRFLLDATYTGEHFSFVGCKGWYERGGTKAAFDQQPIEAVSTVRMLRAAYDATGKSEYLKLQRRAFDWFMGENDVHVPLYDSRTKGCYDGLEPDGVNLNQGAESLLSFLLSLLAIVESYPVLHRIEDSSESPPENTEPVTKQTSKSSHIQAIGAPGRPEKKTVIEPA